MISASDGNAPAPLGFVRDKLMTESAALEVVLTLEQIDGKKSLTLDHFGQPWGTNDGNKLQKCFNHQPGHD